MNGKVSSVVVIVCRVKASLGSRELQGNKNYININKFAGFVPGLGGGYCLCVFFSGVFGSLLMEEKKYTKQNPPKIPGQSREMFVYVFFLYVLFSLPRIAFKQVMQQVVAPDRLAKKS